jgi:predicted component of type VI protein secretion system
MLSLADYRNYSQNRGKRLNTLARSIDIDILMSRIARYTENDCSVLRSKIRELHPLHKASLEAILQHLFRVASRSDKNKMTLEALAARFCYTILRGNAVVEGGVHVKARVNDFLEKIPTDSLKETGYGGSHPKRANSV